MGSVQWLRGRPRGNVVCMACGSPRNRFKNSAGMFINQITCLNVNNAKNHMRRKRIGCYTWKPEYVICDESFKEKTFRWDIWKPSMGKKLNLNATEVMRHSKNIAIGRTTWKSNITKMNFGLI